MLALAGLAPRARAHEVPRRVTAIVHARADGTRVAVVVRVPLAAMRDVTLPLRDDGTIVLAQVEPAARDAAQLWVVEALRLRANGGLLAPPVLEAVRVRPPSDRSFDRLDRARAALAAPQDTLLRDLPWTQAFLDVSLSYALPVADARLAIAPAFARLGEQTSTVLHLWQGNIERVLRVDGDPGWLPFDPSWLDAAARFVRDGVTHILGGIDHLLFLVCLVLPIRRLAPLLGTVTAFTVAHSITLVGAALGWAPDAAWFPPLVEVLIALSIIAMAIENIAGARLDRRWVLAFGFGLVHGFGFAFALRDALRFAGGHLVASLAAFNVGVELGQLLVLAVLVPVVALAWRIGVPERGAIVVASVVVAHSAWHWMAERWAVLRAMPLAWPGLDAATAATAMQLALLAMLAWGAARVLSALLRRFGAVGRGRAGAALAPD
ncbi:MAG: HupE/UreJ family protein [Gemmatimonadaceae bacterium]|nr:HupE/UreJ family protein [Gemmatimonadaceae bacterium]